MPLGVVGKKVGMTRVFTDDGVSVPVTVLHVDNNSVTQLKEQEKDGYRAVQIAYGSRKPSRVNKSLSGHYAKASVASGEGMCEFRLDATEDTELELGAELKVDQFEEGQKVQVTGISKGKGFAGTIKRHNFRGQDNSHGNSISHRVPGSTGQCQTPGRVFKGKKMCGHMGSEQVSAKNLTVVKVDTDRDLILIKGAVPGSKGGRVIVRPTATK
ncbi:MAG: 50S ribosomal protein L3 [Pseudomonadota bacterium]